jgi:hypothetical protein
MRPMPSEAKAPLLGGDHDDDPFRGRTGSTLSIQGTPMLPKPVTSASGVSSGAGGAEPLPQHSMLTRYYKAGFSCVVVANAAMGAGMLAFPKGFKLSGWALGVFLVMLFACIQTFSLSIIARASRNHVARSYEELIGVMFGEQARKFLTIAITIFLYFVCVTYLTVISSQVTHILNEGKGSCDPHCSLWRHYIAHHESGCHKQGSPWIMVTIPVVLLVS